MTDQLIIPERIRVDRETFRLRPQPDYRNLYGRSIIDVLAEKAISKSKSIIQDPEVQGGIAGGVSINLVIKGVQNENPIQAAIGGMILGILLTRIFRR